MLNTTVYEALKKAADFIERNPSNYNYFSMFVPPDLNHSGCLLGWTGYFLGMDHTYLTTTNTDVVRRLGHSCTLAFYDDVASCFGESHSFESFSDHKKSADALRSVAEKYHKQAVREAA